MTPVCSIEGCSRRVQARGWCSTHWSQWHRTGDPLGTLRRTLEQRFWAKVAKGAPGECWEWTAARSLEGYGRFRLGTGAVNAHRVSWQLAHPGVELTADDYICHTCDNPPCMNPAHLFKGDVRVNTADMVAKGRQSQGAAHAAANRPPRGDDHYARKDPSRVPRGDARFNTKLPDAKVAELRTRYAAGGVTQRELAAEYQIGQAQVSRIITHAQRT
jgi:hypothetical protein